MLNYWYSLLLVTMTSDIIKLVRWRVCLQPYSQCQMYSAGAAHLALWVRMRITWTT